MARIPPVATNDLPEQLRERLSRVEDGVQREYSNNGYLTMAHKPELVEAVLSLAKVVMRDEGELSRELKWMVGHITSLAAGCRYCSAHTALNAAKRSDIPVQKIEAIWEYRTSDIFSDAERAALDLGLAAGSNPALVEDSHFEELRKYFNNKQLVELVAVISLFGWFNRWNDTLAVDIEDSPLRFASSHLNATPWGGRGDKVRDADD